MSKGLHHINNISYFNIKRNPSFTNEFTAGEENNNI